MSEFLKRIVTPAVPLLLAACAAPPVGNGPSVVRNASAAVHEVVLDNGLKVIVKEDHRAPVVVSQIWYKVGASDEPDGLTGISHVLEHLMFKGTPKYNGFYARSESAMTGGFSGDTTYPTDAEIQSAKEKTEAALRDSSNLLISSQIPSDFKVLEGARQFNITKTEVNQEVNQEGNFSVFMEGELTVVGFKESDLFDLMATLAQKELGEGVRAKEYSLEYGAVRPDIQAGKIDFSINYSGTFWQPVDIEQFKNSILGKKETDLKAFVFSLPGVERATVSLWPFWVKSVPDKVEKVSVIVE